MSEAPIDLLFLRAQTFDDAELEADLLALFLHQADDFRRILSAPETASTGALAASLHRMKGSARAIGATPLAAAAERAEAAFRQPGPGGEPASTAALRALDDALENACSFAASRLPPNRWGGLAKRLESR